MQNTSSPLLLKQSVFRPGGPGRYARSTAGAWLVGLVLLAAGPAAAQTAAKSADALVESIGVNTHFGWTAYTNDYATVKAKLGQLGIRHVRDYIWLPALQAATDLNTTYGIHTLFSSSHYAGNWGTHIDPGAVQGDLDLIKANALAATEALEGPNEYDNPYVHYYDASETDWVGHMQAYTRNLYTLAKADPKLATLPIIGPSLIVAASSKAIGNLDAYIDHPNIHIYQNPAHEPGTTGDASIEAFMAAVAPQSASGKTPWVTECGYTNAVPGYALDEETEGKYMPRMFAEYYSRGIARSYKYELVSEGTSGYEGLFGFLRNDLSEKPVYRAVKNMIGVLADPGPAFTPGKLTYSLTGSTDNVHQLLLQKRNGDFYLLLWLEVPSWTNSNNTDLYPAAQSVTVNLPAGAVAQATGYALNNNADLVTAKYALTSQGFTLPVTDKMTMIKLSPATTSPPPAPTPPTTTAGLISGATYELVARHSGKALDVAGGGAANETKVQQWTANTSNPNQQWVVALQSDGAYTLTHNGTNECLDVQSNSSQDGAVVWQYAANGGDAQRWVITATDNGYYKLLHKGTNECLDVDGASMADGAPIHQYPYLGYNNQQWRFVLISQPAAGIVSGATYRLSPLSAPSKCLDVANVSQADLAPMHQWDYVGGLNQQWKIVSTGDGFYKLVSANSPSGKEEVLDANGCEIANGTTVQQYQWSNNACQRWSFKQLANGSYEVSPRMAVDQGVDKCLDVSGASVTNGAKIQVWDYLGLPSQQWQLTLVTTSAARSSTFALASQAATAASALSVYPNPAPAGPFSVRTTLAQAGTVQLRLLDGLGRTVRTQTQTAGAGAQVLPFEAAGLPAGLYQLRVQLPGGPALFHKVVLH